MPHKGVPYPFVRGVRMKASLFRKSAMLRSFSSFLVGIFLFQSVGAAEILIAEKQDTSSIPAVSSSQAISSDNAIQSLVASRNMLFALAAAVLRTPHGLTYTGTYVDTDGSTVYTTGTGTSLKIIERVYPDGSAFLYTYDSRRRLTRVVYYKAGNLYESTTTFTYNNANQVTKKVVVYANGITETYNGQNRLTKIVYADRTYRTYAYNAAGLLTAAIYFRANNRKISAIEYGYGPANELLYTDELSYNTSGTYTGKIRTYAAGGIVEHYNRSNRITKRIQADGSYEIVKEYHSTGKIKRSETYTAANVLTGTNTYYSTGTLESVNLLQPDTIGNIYYLYKNENWQDSGVGRIDRAKRQTVLEGELSSVYIYDAVTGALTRIKVYSDALWLILLPRTKEDLIEAASQIFLLGNQMVNQTSGYIYERPGNYYTQPTNIGFWIEVLSQIVTGDIVAVGVTRVNAITRLNNILNALLADQSRLGYKGLLPWIEIPNGGSTRRRAAGIYGQQVAFGDNANLAASIGAAIGALSTITGNGLVTSYIQRFETFLDRMAVGFNYLYDTAQGMFRTGWSTATGDWVPGHLDRFGSEFRSGVLFVTLRYAIEDRAYQNLQIVLKDYVTADGRRLTTIAPYDGGAFQALWPILTMPETSNPGLLANLQNFVDIALDYSAQNNLPGFLSASYSAPGVYDGSSGIPQIAENPAPRNTTMASLYTLGAAFMIRPTETLEFLRRIFAQHPDLVTQNGIWEGINTATGTVVFEKVAANTLTFLLGLAGKGPDHMTRYLTNKGFKARMDSLYAGVNV